MFGVRFGLMWAGAVLASAAYGDVWQGELGLEGRAFAEQGLWGQSRTNTSLRIQPEYRTDWNDRADRFEFIGFARLDQEDTERSHTDIRELSWFHAGSDWDLGVGISKVFWGVTESRHLVDVINQTDLVEDPDGEAKLGQPMVRYTRYQEWGTLEFFLLPYFRERTLPGEDGRFRLPLRVVRDDTRYESGAQEHRLDAAVLYRQRWADVDIGLAHFSGTNRDPQFLLSPDLSRPRLIPYYSLIDQTSLTLQYVDEGWLWKLEALTRSGEGDRFSAAVAGFEFTQVGIWETDWDLGWVVEYLFDDRKARAPHFMERDLFVGGRWTANDSASSEALLGLLWDPQSEERLISLEASRRLADDYQLALDLRVFAGGRPVPMEGVALLNELASPQSDNKLGFLQAEDYLQLELTRFF